MGTKVKKIDCDYSFYLGKNYIDSMDNSKKTSTIVSNHVSWLDAIILIKTIRPAFAPSSIF
jgi:1-acyl-sn-glycerol-3-phosphate acyltransferase